MKALGLLDTLFPRTRAELLRLLFGDAAEECHLRDLARRSGLALGSVQSELAKLAAADLVTSRRDGNRRYFRANRSHPVFPVLRQLVLQTAGLREVLAAALRPLAGVELALVFGSLAAGAGRGSSDIDLLVIGHTGLRALTPALRPAAQQLGREINPLVLTPAEWTTRRRAGDALLQNVRTGRKLFVKGGADELARLG